MTDYESPVTPGKNIVVGQAAVLWADAHFDVDRGHTLAGWILPGRIRTNDGQLALQVCRELNEAIRASYRQNEMTGQSIGNIIKGQIMGGQG